MSLVENFLRRGLAPLFKPGGYPESFNEAAAKWSDAYHEYASQSIAGPVTPTLSKFVMKNTMVSTGGNFYVALTAGIYAYWQASVWKGPGFTGVTDTASLVGLDANLISLGEKLKLSNESDPGDAIRKITNTLHLFTKKIRVITTSASGVTGVAPVA